MSLERLENAVFESTTPLEQGLVLDGYTGGFGEDLQLRYSLCGLATAALQQFLQTKYEINTDRLIAEPPLAPRELNSRKMQHVVLLHEGYIVDPTYSQFLSYVGLNPTRVLNNEELRRYYPPTKIAVINSVESDLFTDSFSKYAFSIIPNVEQLAIDEFPPHTPDNSLVSATLDEVRAVYGDIWSIDNYKPFPIEEKDSMYRASIRIADRMIDC